MLKYIQFKSTYYLLSLTGSYSFKSWFEIKCSKCTKASWRHHQCREDSAPIQLQCCRSWPGPSCRGQRSRWGGSHQLAPSQLPTQWGWPSMAIRPQQLVLTHWLDRFYRCWWMSHNCPSRHTVNPPTFHRWVHALKEPKHGWYDVFPMFHSRRLCDNYW